MGKKGSINTGSIKIYKNIRCGHKVIWLEAFINSYKLLIKSSVIFPYGMVGQK